ncbi:MAG: hypothetical protein M3Y54_00265 [Bacteroidota bacterium]|nr:hypothetical protein [Bacteroidota bacterium]
MATGVPAALPSASMGVWCPPACALIRQQAPQNQATGYHPRQPMGAWQISLQRPGVAGFRARKTQKK